MKKTNAPKRKPIPPPQPPKRRSDAAEWVFEPPGMRIPPIPRLVLRWKTKDGKHDKKNSA